MYTDTGFWDTFRSQFPLTNILHPTMQGRYMQALLAAQGMRETDRVILKIMTE